LSHINNKKYSYKNKQKTEDSCSNDINKNNF